MQLTAFAIAKALDDLVVPSGVFDPTKTYLGVAVAITNAGLATLMSDITLAPGTLAPTQEITTWGPAYTTKTGLEVVDSGVLTFSPTTTADASTIVGWYLSDAATAGNLLGFGFLSPPVILAGPTNILSIVMRISLDPNGIWSAEITWDD